MFRFSSFKTFALFMVAVALTFWGFFTLGVQAAHSANSSGGISIGSTGSGTVGSDGVFPVKARVSWGDGLGAGRGHQGQDLMASCKRRIVASKAGRVRLVDYQASGAGNYVVIRGTDSKFDYVYMHMIKRPRVKQGQRVRAGQLLGLVGSTGRSSACHLHFEMWTRPGWYRGGDVSDPTPYLKKWKRAGN
ncbi:MAG TPA: M23 family metallopeptidase [Solirubrobacterales bacterium]|nr:M23 family metallopeptidase [Solirubrobacterales bacterium]